MPKSLEIYCTQIFMVSLWIVQFFDIIIEVEKLYLIDQANTRGTGQKKEDFQAKKLSFNLANNSARVKCYSYYSGHQYSSFIDSELLNHEMILVGGV